MMSKKKGSPYGDAIAHEFTLAIDADFPLTAANISNFQSIIVDGESVGAITKNMDVHLDAGNHIIVWNLVDPTIVKYNSMGGTGRNFLYRSVTSSRVFFPAVLAKVENWALRFNPSYAPNEVFCYAKVPPECVGTIAMVFGRFGPPALIHVPKGSGASYKEASNWSNYSRFIIDDL